MWNIYVYIYCGRFVVLAAVYFQALWLWMGKVEWVRKAGIPWQRS